MTTERRHLRCFIAVAEELHFARAAEKLHMEQSPLSRAIKDLAFELGTRFFKRTTRSTRITRDGQVFLDEARRVIVALDQAKASVRASANGYHGHLRIGVSDGLAQPRLAWLLALCREEEPDVEIRLFGMPFARQLKGLRGGLLDVGFALAGEVGEPVISEPIWSDPLAVVLPVRHPLVTYKCVTSADALQHPLVLCHPQAGSGCHGQIEGECGRRTCGQATRIPQSNNIALQKLKRLAFDRDIPFALICAAHLAARWLLTTQLHHSPVLPMLPAAVGLLASAPVAKVASKPLPMAPTPQPRPTPRLRSGKTKSPICLSNAFMNARNLTAALVRWVWTLHHSVQRGLRCPIWPHAAGAAQLCRRRWRTC